jgi:N-sulfoglucosamine sulfohydrolase
MQPATSFPWDYRVDGNDRSVLDRYLLIYQPWSDGLLTMRADSMTGLTFAAMERAGQSDPRVAERVKNYLFGVPVSFFDLQTDPGQRRDLIDAPEHQARIARMRDALLREMERTGDPRRANVRTMIAGGKPVVAQPVHKSRQYDMQIELYGPPRPAE